MREVCIVGGGLAGLSLGIALRKRNVPVVLTEQGSYPQHKVCGEFICGVSDGVLEELAVDDLFEGAQRHLTMAWWIGEDKVLESDTPMAATGISRSLLDQRMANKFCELGGVLELGKRSKLEDAEGKVWACGKRKSGGREWVGLKAHFYLDYVSALEMHVGSHGYVGLCPIEDNRVNVCGLFQLDKEIKGKGSELLLSYLKAGGLSSLAERLASCDCDEDSFVATAGFSLGQQAAVGKFCVGDALNLIPPFTGNGMSMALESSALAVPYIEKYAFGETDWNDAAGSYLRQSRRHFQSRMQLSSLLHPLFFKAWSRHALSFLSKKQLLPIHSLFTHLRTP